MTSTYAIIQKYKCYRYILSSNRTITFIIKGVLTINGGSREVLGVPEPPITKR